MISLEALDNGLCRSIARNDLVERIISVTKAII